MHRQSYSQVNSQNGCIYLIEVLLIPIFAVFLMQNLSWASILNQESITSRNLSWILKLKLEKSSFYTRNNHLILLQLNVLIPNLDQIHPSSSKKKNKQKQTNLQIKVCSPHGKCWKLTAKWLHFFHCSQEDIGSYTGCFSDVKSILSFNCISKKYHREISRMNFKYITGKDEKGRLHHKLTFYLTLFQQNVHI